VPDGISKQEYDRLTQGSQFEKMGAPKSKPRVQSHVPEVDDKIVVFCDPEGDRVMTKLYKEAKPAEFAGKELVLDPDESEDVLVLKPRTGAEGLVLAARYPKKTIIMHHPRLTDMELLRRNVRANEERVWNVTVADEDSVSGLEVQRVVYFPDSHEPFEDFHQDVIDAKRQLPIGGQLHVITHKKQGGGKQEEVAVELFGELIETRKGMGGYRLYTFEKSDDNIPEIVGDKLGFEVEVLGHRFPVITRPGLFSTGGLDKGTRLLLETSGSEINGARRLLDIGSGWGAITLTSALHNPQIEVCSVDVEPKAVEVTRDNAEFLGVSDRVRVKLTSDPRDLVREAADLVLSNPPFHESTSVLEDLFSKTRGSMQKGGKVRIVVENSYVHKFSRILERVFGRSVVTDKNEYYTVLESSK
jgi:16S rRNA G1207 methylase RsmC